MHIYLSEIKKIVSRKQFWIIFLFLIGVVFLDFYLTCQYYQSKPLSEIPSAYDILIINNFYDGSIGSVFFCSFPFFLITSLIGSDVFFEEKEMGIHNLTFTRIQRYQYVFYQAASMMTVVMVMIVFVIMLSQGLALTAFPFHGYMLDDVTAYNSLLVSPEYIFSGLRAHNPYLNNIVYAILWGIIGAVFALLSYALAFLQQMKRYTMLMFPMIAFLIYTTIVSQIAVHMNSVRLSQCIETYLLKVNGSGSLLVYLGIILCVSGISLLLIWRGLKNDPELL